MPVREIGSERVYARHYKVSLANSLRISFTRPLADNIVRTHAQTYIQGAAD